MSYNPYSDINEIAWLKLEWEAGKTYASEAVVKYYQSLENNGCKAIADRLRGMNAAQAVEYKKGAYLEDYDPPKNDNENNFFNGSSGLYNPYNAINEIGWLKSNWENGTEEEKAWAEAEAKKYYAELERNGYSDIADKLRGMNSNEVKEYKKNFQKDIPSLKSMSYSGSTDKEVKFNGWGMSVPKSQIDEVGMDLGFYNAYDLMYNKYRRFSRMNYFDTNNKISRTREYLFFTKPDLNILEPGTNMLNAEMNKYSQFVEINNRTPFVLEQLQEDSNHRSPFINLLTNTVRNTLDLPTITTKTVETAATTFGSRITYRKTSIESDEKHAFTLEFLDNGSLEIYNLFDAWNTYGDLKHHGYIKPKPIHKYKCEIDDQISIFKVIVDADYQSIIYVAKVVGCMPEGVPRDAFSEVSNGLLYSVPWKGTFVPRDMATNIADFNHLTKDYCIGYNDSPLYDQKKMSPSSKWATIPYIDKVKSGVSYKYVLKWRG